jgi:hypothetical protein
MEDDGELTEPEGADVLVEALSKPLHRLVCDQLGLAAP